MTQLVYTAAGAVIDAWAASYGINTGGFFTAAGSAIGAQEAQPDRFGPNVGVADVVPFAPADQAHSEGASR